MADTLDTPTEALLSKVVNKLRRQLAPMLGTAAHGTSVVVVKFEHGHAVLAEVSTTEKLKP